MQPLLKFLLLPILGTLLSLSAHAGPGLSGGGKGVVCRNAGGQVQSVEVLDLWEAREIYGLEARPLKGSLRESVLEALKNLSHAYRSDEISMTDPDGTRVRGPDAVFLMLQNHVYPFFNEGGGNTKIRWLRNVNLTPTNDAFDLATPANCGLEQIVSFQDYGSVSGTMLINRDLWDRLDLLNQAALIVHEAFYKQLRYNNAELSSLRTRRAVGLAFAGHRFASLNNAELPKEHYSCVIKPTERAREPSEKGVTKVYLLPVKNSETGKIHVAVQAAALGSVYLLDTPAIKEWDYSLEGRSVEDFSDLSSLVRPNYHHRITTDNLIQPEMDPTLQFEEAGPNGKLTISVSAPDSVFFPNGLPRVRATCSYHRE